MRGVLPDRTDTTDTTEKTNTPASTETRPLVSLVVPVYNEAEIFEASLRALVDHVDKLAGDYRFEILIVDDGSTDETRTLATEFAATHPLVRVLFHRTNFRLGQALRFGFRHSRGDYVVTFDADLTYSPDHISRLLEAIRETGARIVIASPYMAGGVTHGIPFMRRMMSRGANRFLSFTAQDRLATLTGLVRAYDGPFIRTLDLKAVDTDVNTEIIYKAQILRARIEEIPAVLDWRAVGDRRPVTGFNNRLYWNTAKQLVSGFLFRPFMFFLVPGLAVLVAAAVLGVWAVADESARAAVAAGIALVLALQLVALAVLTLQAKRYFEELFHLGTTLRRELSGEESLRPPNG